MRSVMKAAVIGCMMALATASGAVQAQTATIARERMPISGEWRGVYVSPPDQHITEFSATLTERNGYLTGVTVEPNTFGDQSSFWLLANLAGRVEGDSVRFSKTYDGTGGQNHTVSYEGRMIGDRRIVGTWSIGATTGRFEMAR